MLVPALIFMEFGAKKGDSIPSMLTEFGVGTEPEMLPEETPDGAHFVHVFVSNFM
jgi:hypothetical protein